MARERSAAEGRRRGCLFCRRSDGGFSSEEHIFPESLGNTEKILPVGVVCDRCNHEVLSSLDDALCDFGPVSMMRAIYGIPSKSGRMPSFRFDNGLLECREPGDIFLKLDSQKWHQEGLPAPPGKVAWSFTAQRHDMTARRLAKVHRALTKIAVEFAWLDLGEERVLSSEFDRERDIVLNGGHHGYLVLPSQGTPEDRTLRFNYNTYKRNEDQHPLIGLIASFWGVHLATDTLVPEPPGEVPEDEASVHTF
jgi:hypothetical protein